MMRYLKWAGIGGAIGAIGAIAMFPVWQAWVYNFQTLITGIAAVVAATMTIMTMEKTDARSERRHRELVALGLRADRLKLERALYPQLFDLQEIELRFHDFKNIGKNFEGRGSLEWWWMEEVAKRHLGDFVQIQTILQRRQFQDGITLFDGITTRYLEELIKNNDEALASARYHLQMQDPREGDHDYYVHMFEEEFPSAEAAIITAVWLLSQLTTSLVGIAGTYDNERS